MRSFEVFRSTLIGLFALVAVSVGGSIVQAQTLLVEGTEWTGTVGAGAWKRFYVDVAQPDSELRINFRVLQTEGDADIYVRYGGNPSLTTYDFRSQRTVKGETVLFNGSTNPGVRTGRYYIGIYGKERVRTKISHSTPSSASSRGGMGAMLYAKSTPQAGTTFRVWAPNATSVSVAGQFNNWNDNNLPLFNEGNGNWSFDVRGANAGQHYKYVIRNGNQTLWRIDPREQQVTNSVGNSVIFDSDYAWTDSAFTTPNWNEMIIYQMHIGTFNDTAGGRPGTFNSAINRLDYVRDMGVNAIELLPIHEFPGDFSWGYNPSYPYTVEEAYGGPYELKRFINEAHARGIAVLLDVVHNHWGPTDMELWRFDGWSQGNYGGIFFYQDNRSITPWGDTRPDYGRGEVRQYIRDNVMQWLQEFHADGLRWDSVLNIRRTNNGDNGDGWSLCQWANNEVDANFPWKIQIAEDLQGNAFITNETGAGGAGFDSQWSPTFVHPVRDAIIGGDDNNRNMGSIKTAIEQRYSGDAFARVVYTESHDEVANGRSRVPEEIWPGNAGSWFSRKRSTLGGALVMTSPGVPMIFQGQEILEDQYFQDTDPVDWTKLTTYAGINLMYRDLMRLRRNWNNNTRGLRGQNVNVFHTNNTDKIVAFHRWENGGAGDDVIIVQNYRGSNRSNYRIGLPRSGLWRVRFNSDWNGYSSDFSNVFVADVTAQATAWDGLTHSAEITIPAYSTLILSQ
jgi:1,4-alpha-glucan branching enzyme